MTKMEIPRLPRGLEDELDTEHLATELAARARPLWRGGSAFACEAALTPSLQAALTSAFSSGRIIRGLESAKHALGGEQRGLSQVDRKTGVERGGRVSRLLVLSDDGSERFYREVESLMRQHAPRVLALRLSVDQLALGQPLFGADAPARLLMVSHKVAVSSALLALAEQLGSAR